MGTIADKLTAVLNTKNAIKAALIEKGQDAGDVFATYPDKIRAIETGGGGENLDSELSEQDVLISQIQTALIGKGAGSSSKITVSDDGAGTVTINGIVSAYDTGNLSIG